MSPAPLLDNLGLTIAPDPRFLPLQTAVMAQVTGLLSTLWETYIEFSVLDSGPALGTAETEEASEQMRAFSLSLHV